MTGHLIHIGSPKAGSHVLRRWFTEHPQLGYAEASIAGFRDVYQVVREAAQPASGIRYRVTSSEAFSAPHVDAGRLTVTHQRSSWAGLAPAQAAVCTTLAALFPTAHVLLVTRGFRAMIFSMYSQLARTGYEIDFPEFCVALGSLTRAADGAWDYDHLARLYAGAFGVANLTVVPYELLRDDPDAFIRVIETRLGLEHLALTGERLNPSLSGAEMHWYPRLTRLVNALPGGPRLRRVYLRAARQNRFRRPIALAQWLRPAPPVTVAQIPEDLVRAFRGQADFMRSNPLYAPYAEDYLL
jgi:hypothetical protein